MPMGSVQLRPGVNTQRTLSLNESGVAVSNLIRYKDGLIQKYGGWDQYYPLTINSTIREIHAWQGLEANQYLAVGATQSLSIIQSGGLTDITPQTRLSSFAPNFSLAASSNNVVVEAAGSSLTTFDTVYFNTQVNVGGVLIQGAYPVYSVGGSSAFTIVSSINSFSSASITSSGILPVFTTTQGSALVNVNLPYNSYQSIPGLFEPFVAPTSVSGQTIQGGYEIYSVTDSSDFNIIITQQASATASSTMNAGLVQMVAYVAAGPPQAGSGYGVGGYGLGGYGIGQSVTTTSSGTPITAIDWTMDNWGEVLLACPEDGPIYSWSPDSGFSTATVIPQAPFINGGIFISMPQQILVAWRSTQPSGVQDPLLVNWSDADNYTNWTVSNQTAAGSFHIPTGSIIVGGLQAPSFGVIWTDVDVWMMSYIGGVDIFNFTRVGSGCGLIGKHAAGTIAGNVFWMGTNNFFTLGPNGATPLPCTVWDFVFQNLDTVNAYKSRCAPNSTFNEITWFFPVAGGSGENSAYVKFNIIENEWDYGYLNRNSWIDVTALGNPIATDTNTIYQHEISNDANGQPMYPLFESGYWSIADGNDLQFVDWFLPDMKFATYGSTLSAQVLITFSVLDYPGDTPKTYGPFTFASTTEYLSPRLRGRLMSITIQSQDLGTFWRIGRCRYRYAPSGRR